MVQVNKKTLNIRGRMTNLTAPLVMGILNITSDSFFAGSRVISNGQILDLAGEMVREGVDIIDIGGYSTRPGAADVDVYEESDRVESAVAPLNKYFPELIISVDTFRSVVARRAVEAGAHIINDVSGGNLDVEMFDTVAELKVPYVLMHMRGTPQTMNQMTVYRHLVTDILTDLKQKADVLRSKGVADILIDPGFGFAKTTAQNFNLMHHLSEFQLLGYPVLVGISRKASIYKTLNITPEEALNGTTVLNTIALQNGASVLRVHDVKAAVEAVKLYLSTANFMN
ncbi:dihydropteroate synthase [Dyadobacter bucti]|uniref:dihydropteroate synthase n=1 Tax=Dyadobacter bucti TaxID=2572203 RepID=UPI0011098DFD|nr:dihydropteroate synthase [Dyadobacter bucti]